MFFWEWRLFLSFAYGIVALAACLCIVFLYFHRVSAKSLVEKIRNCESGAQREQGDCFNAVIQEALQTQDGAVVMREVTELSDTSCHRLSHVLGRKLMQRYESVDTAIAHCTQQCAGGCIHGIVGEALSVVPEVRVSLDEFTHPNADLIRTYGTRLCEKNREACHGLGHVLLKIHGDFDHALAACDELSAGVLSEIHCKRGVFMENTVSISASDDAREAEQVLIANPTNDLLFPCTAVAKPHRAVCYHLLHYEQEKVFAAEHVSDSLEKARLRFSVCKKLEERPLFLACIEGAAYASSGNVDCSRFSDEEEHAMCVYGITKAKSAFDHYDLVLNYCAMQQTEFLKQSCYQAYFDALLNRAVRSLAGACTGTFDDACSQALQLFSARPIPEIYIRLIGL